MTYLAFLFLSPQKYKQKRKPQNLSQKDYVALLILTINSSDISRGGL